MLTTDATQLSAEAKNRGGGSGAPATPTPARHGAMLSTREARRMFEERINHPIPRATFYSWLECGTIFSIRVGGRILIPSKAIAEVVEMCLNGESFCAHRP